jgi:hypothetical protein
MLQDHQVVRCHAGELITLSVSCIGLVIGLVIGLAQVLGAVEISFSHGSGAPARERYLICEVGLVPAPWHLSPTSSSRRCWLR